jgi:hypothetical protein
VRNFSSSSLSLLCKEGSDVDTVGVSSESHVDAGLDSFFRNYLCTACAEADLVSDTLFDSEIVDPLHVLIVNVVVRDDG